MDRETVRMIFLVVGIFLIACVYIWGRYKDKLLDFINGRGEFDELDGEEEPEEMETAPPAPALAGQGAAKAAKEEMDPATSSDRLDDERGNEEQPARVEPTPKPTSRNSALGAPFLIQLSVVATEDGYFNGEELRDALEDLDLIYGDMGIYHRYDRELRKPLFSVASLVEPGTFPIKDMESYECPGMVLFFQPPQVENPLAVFEDLVYTCHELAEKLGAVEWDERRQPLSEEKIALMRSRLREAY
ncbi:MAG: cell division protein ZipA C-terminal FtsZ-binding domain-containing protein [Methylococcaceae bacterium]|nr:cell division protein ZipA C-terminal FtsZ-binding domain-containing protein [Methylococcaceae bacterium]